MNYRLRWLRRTRTVPAGTSDDGESDWGEYTYQESVLQYSEWGEYVKGRGWGEWIDVPVEEEE